MVQMGSDCPFPFDAGSSCFDIESGGCFNLTSTILLIIFGYSISKQLRVTQKISAAAGYTGRGAALLELSIRLIGPISRIVL